MLRRDFLKYLSSLPIIGTLFAQGEAGAPGGQLTAGKGQPENTRKMLVCRKCHHAIMPGRGTICKTCLRANRKKESNTEYTVLEIDGETHWFDDYGNEYYYARNHPIEPIGKIKDLPISFYKSAEI